MSLSEENMVSGLSRPGCRKEACINEKPAVWNMFFLIQKRNDQNILQMMITWKAQVVLGR
jgi:hypothetical protein